MENYKLKNGKMQNYKKTKNFKKTSKTTPERPGTHLKRCASKNHVLFFGNYAFTTFWAPVLVKNIENHQTTMFFHNKTTKTF